MLSARSVTVEDISLDGIRVTTHRGLAPDSECWVRVWHEAGGVRLKGTVAWCVLGASNPTGETERAPVYTAGIRFHDCRPEDRSMLRRLINATCVGDRERRRYLRATVDARHPVEMTAPFNGVVRELNRGGMLVETPDPIKVGNRIFMELHLEGSSIRVHCRVANCLLDEKDGRWMVGMEFQYFDGDGLEVLSRFMDRLENP